MYSIYELQQELGDTMDYISPTKIIFGLWYFIAGT
jgi:hypothetical protein